MKPGIYYNLSFDEYLAIDAVNSSSLKNMIVSPRNYIRMKNLDKKTRSMDIGRIFHGMILEPGVSKIKCYDGIRRGKKWDSYKEENEGDTIIIASEKRSTDEMRESFYENADAQKWIDLDNGDAEITIIFIEQLTGILCKARIDFLDKACRFFTDLKTAKDVDTHGFQRQFTSLHYYFQFAFYQMALNSVFGLWPDAKCVVVQNGEPFDTVCYNVSPLALTEGKKLVLECLEKLKECKESNTWPGICNETIELDLAAWAIEEPEIEGSTE